MSIVMKMLTALALLAGALPASAQSWPTRPVKIIVPYAPGGSTDNAARAFADKLSAALGQQFVIDNKGGAAGAIGVEAGAKSAPDGHTFVVLPSATVTVLPNGRQTPYDPFKDFTYVGRFVFGTLTFAVHPSVPANDMREFIAYAKANPGKLLYGSSGIGAMPHITFEVMREMAGIDVGHVPYRGGAEAINDMLANHIQAAGESNTMPHAKAGKAKLLAVIDQVRHPDFPDVPTMAEVLPGYDVVNWFGIAGPAGIPQDIVQRLSDELNKIAVMPDVVARLVPLGLRPAPDSPAAMAAAIRADHARFGDLIRRLKISMQ